MPNRETPSRALGLDHLRVLVILLVLLLHAAITYMVGAPGWWYVLDPRQTLVCTGLVLVIDVPIMFIMFFLAGYFALPSLLRRGAPAFLRDKAIRIGIPWVFGTLVLAPPTSYLIYYSRHVPVSLWAFWRKDFWGPAYQQSVYWYLGVLFLCFVLSAGTFACIPRLKGWQPRPVRPGAGLLAGFVLALTLASLLLSGPATFDTWSHNYVLVYQPVRLPLYFGYFALGILAFQQRWFTAEGYQPARAPWSWGCAIAGLAYLAWRLAPPAALQGLAARSITALLFNLFCFSALLASIAQFQSRFAQDGPAWRSQARSSYGVYYLHPLVLYPLALVLVPLPLPGLVKTPLITLAAYLATWGLTEAVLLRAPGLRRIF